MSAAHHLPPSEPLSLDSLITPTAHGISSRILGKTGGGNMTVFAFDEGQGLTEHTSPFDAFVLVLAGSLTLTIGGTAVVRRRVQSCGCRRTSLTPWRPLRRHGCCSSC